MKVICGVRMNYCSESDSLSRKSVLSFSVCSLGEAFCREGFHIV